MKDKFGTVSKILIIVLVCLTLCLSILYFIDSKFNGVVGDWFVDNYIQYSNWNNFNEHYYRETLNWSVLKKHITILAIAIFALFIIATIIFYLIGRYHKKKTIIRETTKLIRDYLLLNDPTVLTMKEYRVAESYLAEIQKHQQAKERLIIEEVNKKNELITYLAHDLKTPLTSVIGYLSLLDEADDMPKEQARKYIQISQKKALRLEALINEFFDITRYNLNEVVLNKEKIDLTLMLNQLAEEFYPVVSEGGNTILVTADEALMIYADPDKLARVFNNILKNAVAYSYPNTEIHIRACKEDNGFTVTFTNCSKTIPSASLEKIFEKFYRLDSARSSSTGGAGLGLAIAKEIITQHGGQISAISKNNMTTFTISLPADALGNT